MIFGGVAFKKLEGLCVGILKFFPPKEEKIERYFSDSPEQYCKKENSTEKNHEV
jgi:hypothetical protein